LTKQTPVGTSPGPDRPLKYSKSQLRWQHILSAATSLFDERGFAASSMQDISDRVGVQKGSLYYYVKSKEMLLFEILRDLHRGGEAIVAGIDHHAPDPLDELRRLLVQIGIYAGEHADRLRIYNRDLEYLTQEQQAVILGERHMYQIAVERLMRRAVDMGHIPADLNLGVAVQTALSVVSAISDWYHAEGTLPLEAVATQVATTVVSGLASYNLN